MTNLAALTTDLQTRFADKEGRFLTEADAHRYLNVAYHEFCGKTDALRRETGIPVVANQYMYEQPRDFVKPGIMMWMKDTRRRLEFKPLRYFAEYGGLDLTRTGPPYFYTYHIGELGASGGQLRLWPSPTSSSETTTHPGNIGASVSTITVVSTANFRDRGWVKLGQEQILYYSKTPTTFNQCERGVGGSIAGTHLAGGTVTQLDIHMWYYYQDTDMTGGTQSPQFPEPFHDCLVVGALYRALLSDGREQQARPALQEWAGMLGWGKSEFQKAQSSNFLNIGRQSGYD